ncbi:MAG: hypothetical protein RIQ87_241 [Chloroflexota bacterium]|jgi:putative FmdB family regulatory protein|nr:MAG: zinc ribbon domain-containing protein [Chloroflexota bacterium]RLT28713.1 MAG: zinc ribbon domain-containing protein [Chloroflexota bacterium]
MPLYDYRCTRCDLVVELLRGIDEAAPAAHEGCGGALERLFTPASVHFKGSGWAKLDRRAPDASTSSAPSTPPATPKTPASD